MDIMQLFSIKCNDCEHEYAIGVIKARLPDNVQHCPWCGAMGIEVTEETTYEGVYKSSIHVRVTNPRASYSYVKAQPMTRDARLDYGRGLMDAEPSHIMTATEVQALNKKTIEGII